MKQARSVPFTVGELCCLVGMLATVWFAYRIHPFAWPVWSMLFGWLLTPWVFRSQWGRGYFRKNKIKATLAWFLITLVSVALASAFQLSTMVEQNGAPSGGGLFRSTGISVICISLMAMVSFDFRFDRRGLVAAVLMSLAAGLLILSAGMKVGGELGVSDMPMALPPIGLLALLMFAALFFSANQMRRSFHEGIGVLGACLLVAAALAWPAALLATKIKHADYSSQLPPTSTSSRPVFKATFVGPSPPDPYWRGPEDFVFPAREFIWAPNTLVDWRGRANPVSLSKDVQDYRYVMDPDKASLGAWLDGTYSASQMKLSTARPDTVTVRAAYAQPAYQYAGNVPPESWYTTLALEDAWRGYIGKHPYLPSQAVSNAHALAAMPRTYALVQRWESSGLDDQQMIDAALAYFASHLAYNFDYQSTDPERNRVDYLLFESRRGVCRHFANAFAIMMRMAGIPSRIVVGFHGGEFDARANIWTVRERDAHAWVEVWLDGKGWVRVDPTAVVPVEKGIPEEPPTLANKMGSWLEVEFPGMFSVAGSSMAGPIGKRLPPLGSLPKLLSILISGLLALWCIAMLVRRYRRRHQAHANDRAWDRLIATARRRGYAISPAMGPASMGAQVSPSLPPALRARWSACMLRYERWKYGGHPDKGLADQLLALRRRLPKRVSSGKTPS